MLNGDPLPPGWTLRDRYAEVVGRWTGRRHPVTGELGVAVAFEDDSADVESVRLLVDGVERAAATRTDGTLADADGHARATLEAWVPRWWGCELALEWTRPDGRVLGVSADLHP
jgi:hypothetical protein